MNIHFASYAIFYRVEIVSKHFNIEYGALNVVVDDGRPKRFENYWYMLCAHWLYTKKY